MSKPLLIIAAICSSIYLSSGYKILFISPLPGKSHAILGEGIVKHLSKAGHEVTYITTLPPDKTDPGVTIVDISDNTKPENEDSLIHLKDVLDKKNSIDLIYFIPSLMNLIRRSLENSNVRELLADKDQHFDVVIAEWMFTEIYAGLAAIFNCPLIWFLTVEPHWMIMQLIDELPNPSYNVNTLSNKVPPLTFSQRAWELLSQVLGKIIQFFYVSSFEDAIYEDLIVPHIHNRGYPVQALHTLKYNASLVLSNSHLSMGMAMRLPPNLIPIGGYHINNEVKPLQKDILKIMDNAKDGVIYFSMGSNLRSTHFPNEIKQALLKIFGELKQTVLWKFEENLPNRPKNVHILKWAPQLSILAHKNCVLFITHGGLLSTTEAIHFGVPIIGIPVFADQFFNVEKAVKKGYAKKVDLSYEMAGKLKVAIQEILSDVRYSINVKELSTIYHDRPVHPSKELVHWVEHVVKTGGARHLRSPAFLMPWYQTLYLDLILMLLGIIIAFKYIIYYICSLIKTIKDITNVKKEN